MPPTQKNRLIAIGTALGDDAPLITSFSMTEELGRLFHIEVELASLDRALDFDKIVGSNATLRLELQGGKTRFFNGYVSRFVQAGEQGDYARYRATLVPWLWFLTRTSDCRIFPKKKVPDILEEVFKGHGFKDYKLRLSGSFPEWEYCVQYRETDFNFVSRLMEQEGIYYYFSHEDGKHTLVLANSADSHDPLPDSASLNFRPPVQDAGDDTQETVTEWVIQKEVQPGVYTLADFDFKNPGAPILSNANITRNHPAASFEVFDYPGEYDDQGSGDAYAKVRIQELQAQHEILRGRSDARGIATGFKFTLKDHPRDDQNRDYLITGATYHVGSSEYQTSGQAREEEFFSCTLAAIPSSQPYRSARITPKPLIQGPQTAIVVGKSGEEIDTDEFGRVKVQFHWDRYGKADQDSSCWVRVSQTSAGKGWGAFTLPRIGQEVIVEFLEGDPDQPIITGRVYNGTAKVPYSLPDNKTRSTFKTNSSKGGQGFNEIRFEDKKGSEQIFIRGEGDHDVRIKKDAHEFVGGERHLIVKKDQLEKVEGNKHSQVKGNHLSKITGDHGIAVEGAQHIKITGVDHITVGDDKCEKISGDISTKGEKNLNVDVGQKISLKAGTDFHAKAGVSYAMDAGTSVHIKAGTTLVIEAGAQLSLKVGGNFVDISAAGVAIKGTLVMINSGGAAGSGSGSSPTAPAAPEAPDKPTDPKEIDDEKGGEADEVPQAHKPPTPVTYSDSAKVLKFAADTGTPFCEECAKAAEQDTVSEVATITKIAWLDGGDNEAAGEPVQWVNLPHDAKWVDVPNNVTSLDRLGQKVRYKVTFSKPGSHQFKVSVVAGDDNAIYSSAEQGRNGNFKHLDQAKTYTTEADGTKIVVQDFFTAAGGGDIFHLVAEDTNNSPAVETSLLHTRRIAYVVVVKMKDMDSIADLATFKSEYLKQGIEIVELPTVEMDRLANISPSEEDTFKQKCKAAFDGSQGKAKAPYAVAIGFTEHLAVKNPNQDLELTDVEAGPDKSAVEIPVQARGLRDGDGLKPRKLWKDLVPDQGWFVSCQFIPDGGGAARTIAEADCTAQPEGSSSCGKVRVNVANLPTGKGTIKVRVHVVDRMRGGLSFPGGNLICICTKAWWRVTSAGMQNSVAIHEMGHKVGMVSNGAAKLPDKVVTFYEAKGHIGPHCYYDLGDLPTYAGATGNQCVMFGAVGADSPTAFCPKCIPAVRKMDLSAGWPAA